MTERPVILIETTPQELRYIAAILEKQMNEARLGDLVPCVQHYGRFVFTIDQEMWNAERKMLTSPTA